MTAAAPDAAHSLRGPVLFWAVLATVALAYMAALALNPDLIAPERRGAPSVAMATAPTPAEVAPVDDEVEALRQTVVQLKAEIATMRAASPAGEDQERAVTVGTAPPAAAIVTGSLPPASRAAGDHSGAVPEPVTLQPPVEPVSPPVTEVSAPPPPAAKSASARKAPDPAPAVGKAAGRKGATPPGTTAEPIGSFTASVTPAAPGPTTPVSPTIISRANSYGVQLASGPTVDTLRVSWNLLNERHKGVLKGLEPRYAVPDDPTAAIALVAGPLTTAEEAARVCSNLRAKRITCAVVSFDGKAL